MRHGIIAHDRFSDSGSVADQILGTFHNGAAGSSGSVTRLARLGVHCYEGDLTTGSRVSRRDASTARSAIGRSRARTTRGQQRALNRSGVANREGVIRRQEEGRRLNQSQLRARTQARQNLRNAGTAAGRRRTQQNLRAAKSGAARAPRGVGP